MLCALATTSDGSGVAFIAAVVCEMRRRRSTKSVIVMQPNVFSRPYFLDAGRIRRGLRCKQSGFLRLMFTSASRRALRRLRCAVVAFFATSITSGDVTPVRHTVASQWRGSVAGGWVGWGDQPTACGGPAPTHLDLTNAVDLGQRSITWNPITKITGPLVPFIAFFITCVDVFRCFLEHIRGTFLGNLLGDFLGGLRRWLLWCRLTVSFWKTPPTPCPTELEPDRQ